MSCLSLGLQVPSEKVFGVGARRVQTPSEEVLGALGYMIVTTPVGEGTSIRHGWGASTIKPLKPVYLYISIWDLEVPKFRFGLFVIICGLYFLYPAGFQVEMQKMVNHI